MNLFVKPMKVIAHHPTDIRLAELHDEHLEFDGVLVNVSFKTLMYRLDTFNDICITERCLIVLFEGLEKNIEYKKWFDIFIYVNVLYFHIVAKSSISKMNLNLFQNRGEFHIFLQH